MKKLDISLYAYDAWSPHWGKDTFLERYREKMDKPEKPKTNRQALELVISITKTQVALANHLGIVRQYVSRWEEVPPQFAIQTAELVDLPLSWIIPETETAICALFPPSVLEQIPSKDDLLRGLIRVLVRPPKWGEWPKNRKRK